MLGYIILFLSVVIVCLLIRTGNFANTFQETAIGLLVPIIRHPMMESLMIPLVSIFGSRIETKSSIKWIRINAGHEKYTIPMPFNRRQRTFYYVLDYDGRLTDLQYPKGIPFICTANDLKCTRIIVRDEDGEERTFAGNDKVELW